MEMESVTCVQMLEEAVCVSFGANAFEKDMNLTGLLPVMSK